MHDLSSPGNLVTNFCDEGLSESLWLAAEGHVEAALFVEPHDSVETTAVQEYQVQRTLVLIEPLPNLIKVVLPDS
ncbi:hypothetical protein THICB1_110368 [Thiomonas arsenitoxydans]|uniref:Uncharacterized protein n=1 Tax=Thiomonas arsenitoxydans (strain DSM 22701 / CIP 110005 / 3As) TaxID=426114 RepID=A0ABM9T3R5_THIA3|nr:hypothetical protein THICB1_110368 [Thiomonas arsenitoxydans]CQR30698.1 hypothetical protein THICB6_150432 [Thiomonas arsenitoxydans]CQR31711.1 hypothetical protein ACO3_30003 [Thiomonas arsenitoxydans]CQR31915.1 hypothetical protein ACO7_30003 [Thiomonas arsenitoxydans]